jgi:glycosyltransferase involved in cell wall biosynthesis
MAAGAGRRHDAPVVHLLAVSHPSVVAANQLAFVELERRLGWTVTLVVPERWPTEYGEFRAEAHPALRGELIALPTIWAGDVPRHLYRASLTAVVRRVRPDVVYAHHEPYGLATYQLLRATRRAGVSTFGFYSAQNILKRRPAPIARAEAAVLRAASFALPVSDAVLDVLRAKGYAGPATVLPLGVDADALTALAPPDPTAPVLGYVGRLSAEKGVDTLLRALALLPPRVTAAIAGDGPQRPALEALAAELGVGDRVRWLGYVPHAEVARAYGEMSIVVVPSLTIPSWKEQFGRVVIEALAAGRPVVASDSGELPRLLAATGGGWTFPEADAPALAALTTELLADLRSLRSATDTAQRAVVAEYGLPVLADRFGDAVGAALDPTPA